MSSKAKMLNLEKELKSVILKKDNKYNDDRFDERETEQFQKDFHKLESEFQLLNLCPRNQIPKL